MPFLHDPDAVLDYHNDWAEWLAESGNDTIASSSWTAENGITIESYDNTTTIASVILSGGTAGTTYDVTNHIVTAAGREEDRTIKIKVRER